MLSKFRVKTERGGGWYIPQAPECPPWETYLDARRYADFRDDGLSHDDAYGKAEGLRLKRLLAVDILNRRPPYRSKIRP